jgi:hypothetical protein
MHLKETVDKVIGCILVAGDSGKWRAVVNVVMNCRVPVIGGQIEKLCLLKEDSAPWI